MGQKLVDTYSLRAKKEHFIEFWMKWAAPVMLAAFWISCTALALLRHASFHTHLLDLGYYTQVLWNTARGHWFATTLKPPSFLADHFSPLLAVIAPIFVVAPDARTLLIIESLVLTTAILPGYLILKTRYPMLAPFLVLGFVLNPIVHATASEEFHEIMLAVPLLAMATYALYTAQNRILLTALFLTLLVREDMAIYVASFGLYFLLCRYHCSKQGFALIGIAILWFLAAIILVIPAFGEGSYRHAHLLAPFGKSIPEIIQDIVRKPLLLFQLLLTPSKAKALFRFLGPLAGIPFIAAGQQLLWVPALLLLLISPEPTIGTLSGWYIAPLLPLLWSSTAQIITGLRPRLATASIAGLIFATFLGFRAWSPFPGGSRFQVTTYKITNHTRIGHHILASIPPAYSVAAQSKLGAHLGTREQLFLFPWYNHDKPPSTIILDATDEKPYPLTPSELQFALYQLQMDLLYRTVWEQDGYFVFQVTDKPAFPQQTPKVWLPWLRLEGYELAQTDAVGAFVPEPLALQAGHTLRVMLYWTALAPMTKNYSISARLLLPDGRLLAQDDSWPGRGILATSIWPQGQTIRDTHYIQLPPADLPDGLALSIVVYETDTVQPILPAEGYILKRW